MTPRQPSATSRENRSRGDAVGERPVFGVDILPGKHPSSSTQPHYAVSILDPRECREINSYGDVSLSRLIRMIWEEKPSIIAVDNVFELAEDEKKLAQLLSILPSDTRLIQVTGWGRGAANIKSVARSLGINVYGKLSPLQTARLAALIACRGHGFHVRFAEEKTRIIVARGRNVGHGGMSYNRYRRSIRAGILSVTKEIKKKLDAHKLDYDLTFRKSQGGLERSVFTVYAPREKLYGVIKPIRTKSVRVEIKPVYRDKIILPQEASGNRRPIIIGVDPGIYTGVAALSLDGEPLLTYSSKNLDRGEIISMVSSIGVPVIVATDVNPPPDAVKKLAASLRAELYVPPENISSSEKQELLTHILDKNPWLVVEDTHERDALVAAYKAYLSIADKMRQVDAKLSRIDIDLDPDAVKLAIIRGKTMAEAIEEEIERIMSSRRQGESTREAAEKTAARQQLPEAAEYIETINRLKEKIGFLEAEKKRLEDRIAEQEETIKALRLEISSLRHALRLDDNTARLIERLRIENTALKKRIDELEKKLADTMDRLREANNAVYELVSGGYIPLPVARNSLFPNIARAARIAEEKSLPAIYVDDEKPPGPEACKLLSEKHVAILYKGPRRIGDIPLINVSGYRHRLIGDWLYVEPGFTEAVEEAWRIIEERRRDDEYERIVRLVEEYQRERRRLFEEMMRKNRMKNNAY